MEFIERSVGELAISIRTGTTPTKNNEKFFDGEFLWVTPSDLKGQMILKESESKVSKLALESNQAFLFPENTVLISTIGDIAKVTINEIPVSSNQQITGVTLKKELILPELFFYWVKLNKRLLQFKANKAVISILTNKHLRKIKVSYPIKVTDQQKIVSNLNSIQLLINQKLVLLDLLKQFQRSSYFEIIGDPILNNQNHEWKLLGNDEYFYVTSGSTPKFKSDILGDDIYWIKSGDINNNIITSSTEKFDVSKVNKSNLKIHPQNSILIALAGQGSTRGSVGLLGMNASCNQNCGVIYPNHHIRPIVIFSQFRYSYSYLRNIGKGEGRDIISLKDLKKMKILIPKREVQNQYETLWNTVELIIKSINQQLNCLKQVFESYLHSSLSGIISLSENEAFEDLIDTFNLEQIKENNRLSILIDWIEHNKFSDSEKYDVAFKHLLSLLDEGTIEQKSIRGKIKLMVSE